MLNIQAPRNHGELYFQFITLPLWALHILCVVHISLTRGFAFFQEHVLVSLDVLLTSFDMLTFHTVSFSDQPPVNL